jgi:hypothetical protein
MPNEMIVWKFSKSFEEEFGREGEFLEVLSWAINTFPEEVE